MTEKIAPVNSTTTNPPSAALPDPAAADDSAEKTARTSNTNNAAGLKKILAGAGVDPLSRRQFIETPRTSVESVINELENLVGEIKETTDIGLKTEKIKIAISLASLLGRRAFSMEMTSTAKRTAIYVLDELSRTVKAFVYEAAVWPMGMGLFSPSVQDRVAVITSGDFMLPRIIDRIWRYEAIPDNPTYLGEKSPYSLETPEYEAKLACRKKDDGKSDNDGDHAGDSRPSGRDAKGLVITPRMRKVFDASIDRIDNYNLRIAMQQLHGMRFPNRYEIYLAIMQMPEERKTQAGLFISRIIRNTSKTRMDKGLLAEIMLGHLRQIRFGIPLDGFEASLGTMATHYPDLSPDNIRAILKLLNPWPDHGVAHNHFATYLKIAKQKGMDGKAMLEFLVIYLPPVKKSPSNAKPAFDALIKKLEDKGARNARLLKHHRHEAGRHAVGHFLDGAKSRQAAGEAVSMMPAVVSMTVGAELAAIESAVAVMGV